MCGIFFYRTTNKQVNIKNINDSFNKIKHRGPDYSYLTELKEIQSYIGFHRLKINDLSDYGNQPFFDNEKGEFLMCNGEIYNHLFLEEKLNIKTKSTSDCEFLLPYLSFHLSSAFYKAISDIDGVFAIVYKTGKSLVIIRDRYGVKPIFYSIGNDYIVVSSEAKVIDNMGYIPNELHPGSYMVFDMITFKMSFTKKYYNIDLTKNIFVDNLNEKCVLDNVNKLLIESVRKRMMSDREISCLLSGGLDSSLVSSILSREMKKQGKRLKTYSIGFPDSTDIKYARKVSKFIDSDHYEYILEYKDALDSLPEIVNCCETFDITTIRASTPMYLLCKYISTFKNPVVFSGEGSDEVFAGYLYFHKAPTLKELDEETKRLVKELWKYDVLRADRCTSGNGLDLREPFLDRDLIDFMMSLDPKYKSPRDGYEKWLLRKAFDNKDEPYLPEEVLWRRKAAFSDAVSSSEKPWYKYIQEHVKQFKDKLNLKDFPTEESAYYNYLFQERFNYYRPVIKYWLPKWDDNIGIEPSATVLKHFNKEEH
jgi:asparagine synthase (glutamine-hydrolysing)